MRLEHRFTVPVPPDVAWEALLDPERVAPCFPGATLQSVDGPAFTGTVKVRLGPIALLYKGKGVFTQTDAAARRTVIEASGKDARGNGTAAANVAVHVTEDGEGTAVELLTDLTVTGRPAQLGRGLIADVGGKLVTTFADCLAERLAGPRPEPAAEPGPSPPPEPGGGNGRDGPGGPARLTEPGRSARSAAAQPEINLIEFARVPVLKRALPVLLVAVVLLLLVRRLLKRS